MNILSPDFTPLRYTRWIKDQKNAEMVETAIADLTLYRAIESKLGRVKRPDFEHDNPGTMVFVPFVANPKQDAFFHSKARGRWLSGGNRSGKSQVAVMEAVSYCLGFRPWLSRKDAAYRTPFTPPVSGRIFGEKWDTSIRGIIVPKMYDLIPPELLARPPKKQQNGVESIWEIKVPFDATGKKSIIEISTYNTDARGCEGWSGHFAEFDEPPPRAHWIATTRGLVDTGGHWWMAFTPIVGEQAWLFDEIIQNPAFEGFKMSIWDNLYDPRKQWGALTEQNIEDFLRTLSPTERASREYGEFPHLSGSIFKDFMPVRNVVPGEIYTKEFPIPKKWWRSVFLDPASRKPHTVLFVAWDEKGTMYCYDGFRMGDASFVGPDGEEILYGKTVDDLIEEIHKRCDPYPQRFFVDSAADAPDMSTGLSMYDSLISRFPFEKWEKVKDKKHAIFQFQNYLEPNPRTGVPKFFVFSKMKRLIWEMMRYRWDEYRNISLFRNDPKPVPVKKDDDFVDCVLAASMNPPPDFKYQGQEIEIPDNEWAKW